MLPCEQGLAGNRELVDVVWNHGCPSAYAVELYKKTPCREESGGVVTEAHLARLYNIIILDSSNMVTSDVCLTPQCVTAAAEILHNLHPNYAEIDPCERFDDCMYSRLFSENVH